MPKKPKRKIKIKRRARRSERRISEIGLKMYRDKLREHDMIRRMGVDFINYMHPTTVIGRLTTLDDMLPPEPTINRIPRPEPT